MYQEETAGGRFCRLLKNVCTDNKKHIRSERRHCFGNNQRRRKKRSWKNYLSEEGYDTSRVVVEQNLQIIPQDQLENTLIQEGDQIEILCFVGGG